MGKIAKCAKVFFVLMLLTLSGFGYQFKLEFPFEKKKKIDNGPKMPQTKEQWLEEAKNIPLKDRVLDPFKEPQTDKENYYPTPRYGFEKYNYPQGKRELNIENIKKYLIQNPIIVSDIHSHYVAYSKYYYSPQNNQISSQFFIGKLDLTKNKTRRILAYNHNQEKRTPILESGMSEYYPNLFSGLTLVDWDRDSKKLLIKEKIGSTQGGIYKTNLYIHFLESNQTIKLENLHNTIKNYFLDSENIDITKHRYYLEPLGFSSQNDDVAVVLCYCYDKKGDKVFFGTWFYNCKTRKITLHSRFNPIVPISLNGLILKRVLE